MVANDGFYVLLQGLARRQTQIHNDLIEDNESTAAFTPQSFHSFVLCDYLENATLAEMYVPPGDTEVRHEGVFFPYATRYH